MAFGDNFNLSEYSDLPEKKKKKPFGQDVDLSQYADLPPDRTFGEAAQDTGIDLAAGTLGLGESAVGLADIATGNLVGKGLSALGYDPGTSQKYLSSQYSDARQAANREVEAASGFEGTLEALLSNPIAAAGQVVQSAPMLLGSAGAARGIATGLLKKAGAEAGTTQAAKVLAKNRGKILLGGTGAEGAMTAGSIQEKARQEGRDYTQSVLPALAAGATTAAIGYGTSRLPGFRDIETTVATQNLGRSADNQLVSLVAVGKQIAKDTFKEGALEELPQSAQEQIFTNLALGKPTYENVEEAAATGLVVGAGMGGAMSTPSSTLDYLRNRNRVDSGGANDAVGGGVPETSAPTVGISGINPNAGVNTDTGQGFASETTRPAPTPEQIAAELTPEEATTLAAIEAIDEKSENDIAQHAGILKAASERAASKQEPQREDVDSLNTEFNAAHNRQVEGASETRVNQNNQKKIDAIAARDTAIAQRAEQEQSALTEVQSRLQGEADLAALSERNNAQQSGFVQTGMIPATAQPEVPDLIGSGDAALPRENTELPAGELSKKGVSSSLSSTLYDENDVEHKVTYQLVEASDLQASVEKGVNQYRDRTRPALQAQVARIANNPILRKAGESPVMEFGAPVVSDGGKIVAGNGRYLGITGSYNQDTAQNYKKDLLEQVEAMGIDPVEAAKMDRPVLIRRLSPGANVNALAMLSNEGGAAPMSALEQSQVDAERLGTLSEDVEVTENGEMTEASKVALVKKIVSGMSQNQVGAFEDQKGRLSQEGERRLDNALLNIAYGDSSVLARLTESRSNELRNIAKALIAASPKIAVMRAGIRSGNQYNTDPVKHIIEAVEVIAELRRKKTSLNDWLAQQDAFNDLSQETETILRFFDENIRSPKKIQTFLINYTELLNQYGDPTQTGLFEQQEPTTQELLNRAKREETNQPTQDAQDDGLRQATGEQPGDEAGDANRNAKNGGTDQSQVAVDLLGDDTQGKQALKDAEKARDTKRNADDKTEPPLVQGGDELFANSGKLEADLLSSAPPPPPPAFVPTHELSDGTLVIATDETGVWEDADGVEIEDSSATPIAKKADEVSAKPAPTEAVPTEAVQGDTKSFDEFPTEVKALAELFYPNERDPALLRNVAESINERLDYARGVGRKPLYTVRVNLGGGKRRYQLYRLDGKKFGILMKKNPGSTNSRVLLSDMFIEVPQDWTAPDLTSSKAPAPKANDFKSAAEYHLAMSQWQAEHKKAPSQADEERNQLIVDIARIDKKIISIKKRIKAQEKRRDNPGFIPPAIIRNAMESLNAELEFANKNRDRLISERENSKKSQGTTTEQKSEQLPPEKAPTQTPKRPGIKKTNNTLFTDEMAEKALSVLRSKLGTPSANPVFDPEILSAVITLAGHTIESGARTFAAYSKVMVNQLGDNVRPYLRSGYEGVRAYPGINANEMTPAAEIEGTGGQVIEKLDSKKASDYTEVEFYRLINTAPRNAYTGTITLDYGNSMRGQGKRSGGMVTGTMSDVSLQGKKQHTNALRGLPDYDKARVEAEGLATHEQSKYAQVRAAGFNHDTAMLVAYSNVPDAAAYERAKVLDGEVKTKAKAKEDKDLQAFTESTPEYLNDRKVSHFTWVRGEDGRIQARIKTDGALTTWGEIEDKGKEYGDTRYQTSDGETFAKLIDAKRQEVISANEKLYQEGYLGRVGNAQVGRIDAKKKGEKKTKPPKSRIDDVGEKIGGAAKDTWGRLRGNIGEGLTDNELKTLPLNKAFPEPDYKKLSEAGADPKALAIIKALRDQIPQKGRTRYKLNQYIEGVKAVREVAARMLDDADYISRFYEGLNDAKGTLSKIKGRVDLLLEFGFPQQEAIPKGITLEKHHYSIYGDEKNVNKWVVDDSAKSRRSFGGMGGQIAATDTREEAVAALKEHIDKISSLPKQGRSTKFKVYQYRGKESKRGWIIGKKIGKNYVDLKEGFKTSIEAGNYRNDNQQELEDRLTKFKTIPAHRKPTNEARLGEDYRKGKDVSADEFIQTFGFRGVEFGNWVDQEKRQDDINDAYDGLMDLANLLKLPPAALSLNGELAIAFGARGKGGKDAPKAHYELEKIVINLTKKDGAGSLAHEFWHSLDNYFSRSRGEKTQYVTQRPDSVNTGIRTEMVNRFKQIMATIKTSSLPKRAAELDKRRAKPYWATDVEMSARAFESYIIGRMKDNRLDNDYLVNIVSPEYWTAAEALGMETENSYPYILPEELEAIVESYDAFFAALKTKKTDSGIAIYESEGLYSGYEIPTTKAGGVANTYSEEAVSTGDLFSPNTLPNDAGSAKAQAKDSFQVEYRQVPLGQSFKSGFDTINTPAELAHLVAPLRKHAQESFLVVVLDKNNKVINLIRHTKGAKDASIVTPSEVVGAIAATDGAAGVYLAHNHPSGDPRPSSADYRATNDLVSASEGLGVNVLGHIVVGEGRKSAFFKGGDFSATPVETAAAIRKKTIPLTERVLKRKVQLEPAISTGEEAIGAVVNLETTHGLLLLNNKNRPIGVVALTRDEMAKLRDGKQIKRILTAISTTNAAGAIPFNKENSDISVLQNLGNYISRLPDIRLLDAVVRTEAGYLDTLGNQGKTTGSKAAPFFSRQGEMEPTGTTKAQVETWLASPLSKLGNWVKVEVVQSVSDLPKGKRQHPSDVRGMFLKGKVYLVADNIASSDARAVLAHESVGHLGIEKLLGPVAFDSFMKQIQNLKRLKNKQILAAVAEIKKNYVDESGNYTLDEKQEAREIFAHLAENNPNFGIIRKIKAALRLWLAKNGFGNFDDAMLESMIVRAAKQTETNYSGFVVDANGRRKPDYSLAWHGSPNVFNKFSTDAVGVGQGNHEYGWGLYFTSDKEVAEWYKNELSQDKLSVIGVPLGEFSIEKEIGATANMFMGENNYDIPKTISSIEQAVEKGNIGETAAELKKQISALKKINRLGGKIKSSGKLYKVTLSPKEDEYLLWNKPISEQSDLVKKALQGKSELTGKQVYLEAQSSQGGAEEASQHLRSLGIRGIKYLDGSSRNKGNGSYNYVIFDDADVEITEAYSRTKADLPESEFDAENRRLREQHKGLWDKAKSALRRQLVPGGNLPKSAFDEKLQRDFKMAVDEFDIRHDVGRLENAVKAAYGKAFNKLDDETVKILNEALRGKVSDAIPEPVRVEIVKMRQRIDSQSKELMATLLKRVSDLTGFNASTVIEILKDSDGDPAFIADALESTGEAFTQAMRIMTIASNMGEYVNRSYKAFDDPKWFKKIPDSTIDDARRYLLSEYKEKNPEDSDAETSASVERVLHELVKTNTAYDSMSALISESKLGAKDLSTFIRRKEIAPEIRALLGEYEDPRINFSKSMTTMSRMIWNHRFLEKVLDHGLGSFVFTKKTKPPEATVEFASQGSTALSPLDGLWMTPEVNQAFLDAVGKDPMENWYRLIVQANGMVKMGKTILSPTTAMRNWQSAMLFSMANGHFDLSHAGKSLTGLREYFSQTGDPGKLAYLKKLKLLGVVYDSPYAGEMMRLLDDSKLESILIGKKGQFVSAMRYIMENAKNFYSYGDDFWKIIGFENEKAMLMKVRGMTEVKAEKMAAERIRNTYPTYSMVGRGIQQLRRFPLAGTFVSFPAEIIRTSYWILRYAAEDMKTPEMRPLAIRRMIGISLVSSAAYAVQALSAGLLDIDDDEEEAIRDLAAPWQKNANLWFIGRNKQGQLQYFDISFIDPYNYWKRPITAVLRDQPWEKKAGDVAAEIFKPFFGTDIAAGALFELAANKRDSGGEIYSQYDKPWNQAKDIGNHLRKALQPGFASNIERTYKAAKGDKSSSGRTYTLSEEAMAWAGWRISTLDPKTSLYYRSYEFKDAKRDSTKGLNRVLRNPNKTSNREIVAAAKLSGNIRANAYQEFARVIHAARKSGMNDLQIRRVLRNSGITKQDLRALLKGTVPPFRISQSAVRSAIKKANAIYDRETVNEFKRRYRFVATL